MRELCSKPMPWRHSANGSGSASRDQKNGKQASFISSTHRRTTLKIIIIIKKKTFTKLDNFKTTEKINKPK